MIRNRPLRSIQLKEAPPVKVVFVDSDAHIYNTLDKQSNADFLAGYITKNSELNSRIQPNVKTTHKTDASAGSDAPDPTALATAVVGMAPDLIVLHRSAFYTKQVPDKYEAKLVRFLIGIKGSEIVVLVYSRKPNTDGKYAAGLEKRSGLKGRICSYQFPDENPFEYVDHFLNNVLLLAQARTYQKSQQSAVVQTSR